MVFGDSDPFPGPYNRAAFPYFDEILKALSPSDPCRYVTFVGSAQVGKTVLGNIFALGSVTMGRGTVLVCHPTIDNALRWSKLKLAPMMRSTPIVQGHFPQRSRDTSDALLFKERADGLASLLITGANSPASLSQITVNFQVQDDLSKWEMNAAGDPETQAEDHRQLPGSGRSFKVGDECRRRSGDAGRQPIARHRVRQVTEDLDAARSSRLPDHQGLRSRLAGNAVRSVSALLAYAGAGVGQHARSA